MVEDTG